MTASTLDGPMLSVAVITYNHARWIRQCFEGIDLQQISVPFEVCIGDDGSSDGTTAICAEYAARPHRGYTVTHQVRDRQDPARRQYDAVFMPNAMATLRACRGKYVAIIEGDDFWTDPGKLAAQVRFLESHGGYSMVIHNATVSCDPPRGEMPLWIDPQQRPEYREDRDFAAVDWPNVLFPSCSVVVRRDVVDRLIHSDLAYGPAWDSTMLYVAGTRGTIRFLATPMGCYRIHAGACWNGPLAGDRYEVMLRFAARLLKFVPELTPEVRGWVQTLFDYNYFCVATNSASSTEFRGRMLALFPEGTEQYHRDAWLATTAAAAILKHLDGARQLRDSRSYQLGRTIANTLTAPKRALSWLRQRAGA